ncbi:methyl-accepting chemotaxis protein [Desulfoluna spongiiphila]|uniref:methyl-accepting chemotaxis protein n=1 Tax=Desulfoluna spongiiphila TaxID=419481 RepID=UPI001253A04F|nr:methyl-accepting chemotaxis protein [Desulfoluna spongiiphila]VVS91917.1 methyl-accepting chemotaxis protein (mcp) signalling domain [Desulfoluna spongiiphila]
MKLKVKLLLSMIIVGMLPALFVAGYASYRISGFIESRQSEQMVADSQIAAEYLRDFLDQRTRDIRLLLANPILGQSLITDFDYGDVDTLLTGLVRDKDNPFSFFMVTNQGGSCVSASDPHLIGGQHADEAWYRQTLSRGTYCSDWHEQPEGSVLSQPPFGGDYRYTIVISAAIPDADGGVLGTLSARVKWQLVQQWLEGRVKSFRALGWESKSLTVMRADGTVIGHELGSKGYGRMFQESLDDGSENMAYLEARDRGFFREVSAEHAMVYGFATADFSDFSWKVLTSASEEEFFHVQKEFLVAMVFVCILCLLVAVGLGLFTGNGIVRPLNRVVSMLQGIATGEADLTARLPMGSGKGKPDEIGALSLAFNTFIGNLERLIRSIRGNAETIGHASVNMDRIAGEMSGGARQMSADLGEVASSSEVMNANMDAMATAIDESDRLVGLMAESARTMTASVKEVADQSEQAKEMTREAVAQAELANTSVEALGKAAGQITLVTETIKEIADQTNLLALNATIEAARAGEAGKGFAVVADEIKALARQTAEATLEIEDRVSGVQDSTTQTVQVIDRITQSSTRVSDMVSTIATAVALQADASREISAKADDVSRSMQEGNEHVTSASGVNALVSREIGSVKEAADGTSHRCIEVGGFAGEQKAIGIVLQEAISRFRVTSPLFDMGKVKNAHFDWKMGIETALQGIRTMEPGEVPGHGACAFGRWYASVDDSVAVLPQYRAVGVCHQEVHTRAEAVVSLHAQGKAEEARAEVARFEEARNALFEALDELYLCR